jgi:type IV secretion system protein VirB9
MTRMHRPLQELYFCFKSASPFAKASGDRCDGASSKKRVRRVHWLLFGIHRFALYCKSEFPKMSNTWMVTLLMSGVLASSPVSASKLLDFPTDGRIKMLEYHANDIYSIATLYGYQTNVELEEGEEVQTISVGDRSLWQIIPSGSRLFIRPMDEDVSTNMTVITNLRAYQFDLRAGKGKPKDNPDLIYVAKFMYPKMVPFVPPPPPPPMPPAIETPGAMPTVPATNVPVVPKSAAAPYNYLYSYSGKDELAPTDTYDDGQRTYVRFANTATLPKVFAVTKGGARTPVDYTLQADMMVLPQVEEQYVLVYGESKEKEVYLYNENKPPVVATP